jgi:hypothetical protein
VGRNARRVLVATVAGVAQLVVVFVWSHLVQVSLFTGILMHVLATPTCIVLLRTIPLHPELRRAPAIGPSVSELRRAPVIGPSVAVAVVLVGWAGLGVFHDALESSLGRLPEWSGTVLFFMLVSFAALVGGVIQDDAGGKSVA